MEIQFECEKRARREQPEVKIFQKSLQEYPQVLNAVFYGSDASLLSGSSVFMDASMIGK